MRALLVLISFFLFTCGAFAKDVAVMLYVVDEKTGDEIYDKYTKDLGFARKLKASSKQDFEFHVTLGYVVKVEEEDYSALKEHLNKELSAKVKKDLPFEVGVVSMLGGRAPYIVALPKNDDVYTGYNKDLYDALKSFKDGKYHLSDISLPEHYIPHFSLNAKVHNQVPIEKLVAHLQALNSKLTGAKIVFSRIVVN